MLTLESNHTQSTLLGFYYGGALAFTLLFKDVVIRRREDLENVLWIPPTRAVVLKGAIQEIHI